ncbi:integrase core domain-containing protein [Ectopseudomonas oleovorans]|uniref:Integrase catalytic domain-containing protein n=1 Tax=Ectopseudomonas oleovorans TaxID=301 RepID=A0A427H7Q8_ECTOL|nr:hypothetical protein DZC76_22540 [Pseudomonas sp. phDV1]RRW26086.1 hypothetical protein EGJ44_22310 [Pseudomonas oleovorans]TXR38992.1 transposase [Pseudomonas mendocina]
MPRWRWPSHARSHDRRCRCTRIAAGGCWDNAAIESFFSSFNAELVYLTRYEAKTDLLNYIRLYSHPRRHSTLGYLSPIEV